MPPAFDSVRVVAAGWRLVRRVRPRNCARRRHPRFLRAPILPQRSANVGDLDPQRPRGVGVRRAGLHRSSGMGTCRLGLHGRIAREIRGPSGMGWPGPLSPRRARSGRVGSLTGLLGGLAEGPTRNAINAETRVMHRIMRMLAEGWAVAAWPLAVLTSLAQPQEGIVQRQGLRAHGQRRLGPGHRGAAQ